jgi:uncharacterized membrane protein YphA (DoxX/SURF4 family)
MQRLFSTFPDGRPGAGLLLLRAAIGGSLLVLGGTYLVHASQAGGWGLAIGLVAAASGASLLIGFLTPLGVLVGLVAIGLALVWPSPACRALPNGKLAALLLAVFTAAVALLGPGAISLDARLFGRREINIPRVRNGPPEE